MTPMSIAITNRGYTDELYETCGYPRCISAILEALGVDLAGRDPLSISTVSAGDGVDVSVLLAGETDYDVWCAACGEFLHHGLSCDHSDSGQDLPPLHHPHINLKNAPSIQSLWR